MSLIATAVKHMMDAGMPSDTIIAAIAAMEAEMPTQGSRSKAAIRQANYRERKASQTVTNHNETSQNVTNVTPVPFPAPPNENNLTPPTHTPETITRARKETPLPSDWEPVLTANSQRIIDGWPPGMLDRQVAQFKNYAADKGRKSKDWQAAFRTWIGKADDWKPKQNGNFGRNQPNDGMGVSERAARQAIHELSGGTGSFADSRGSSQTGDYGRGGGIIDALPSPMRSIGYATGG